MKRFHISNYVSFRLNSVAEVTNIYVGVGGGDTKIHISNPYYSIQRSIVLLQVECVYVF